MAVTLNSLNTIIADIQQEIANSNISESSPISTIQIEQWIHQYHCILIKRDIDRGRDINPSYIQSVNGLELQRVDIGMLSNLNTSYYVLRSVSKVPRPLDYHFKTGITLIQDIYGNTIQLMSEERAHQQKNRRYTATNHVAYIKDDYLYIEGPTELGAVNIRIVAEVPPAVDGTLTLNGPMVYDYDAPYQCPSNLIPELKSMIFKQEFGIMLSMPVDDANNTTVDTEVPADAAVKTAARK